MTAYHGGKQRIGKKLAKIIVDESIGIEEDYDFDIKGYCEPFCGMLGVYKHIPKLFEEEGYTKLKYKAGDTNTSVIKMWKAAQKGWKPPTTCSEKEYNRLKKAKPSACKGFIGHQCSFGGQFFKGFAKKYDKTKSPKRAAKRVSDIAAELCDVRFKQGDYQSFSGLKNHVIYCDPPYRNVDCRYKTNFDNNKFWAWCKKMSERNVILVSEYSAPKEVTCIFNISRKATSHGNNKCSNTEKLFFMA